MLPLGSRSTTLERQGRKNEMRGLDSNHGRLALAREHAGFKSARQAAQAMGWVYATYASHESGLRDFPQKVAEKYARVPSRARIPHVWDESSRVGSGQCR